MDTLSQALTQAEGHLQAGAFAQAEGLCRTILARDPQNLEAMSSLGLAVAGLGNLEEAITWFSRILLLEPAHKVVRTRLGTAYQDLGKRHLHQSRLAEATYCFFESLRCDPARPECHFQLGCVFQAQERMVEAVAHFERAVALNPEYLEALLKLGTLFSRANRFGAAAKWYRWILAIDSTIEEANFNLAAILESDARLAEAQIYRRRTAHPQPLIMDGAVGLHRRVLLPWAAGSGSVPIDALLPPETTTRIRWIVECATDDQEAELPPYDVAFNAIGNADILGPSHARLARLHAKRPILNPPDQVARTRRDLLPDLLAGIPNVVVPKVHRVRRADLIGVDPMSFLAALGLECPFLLRPICTQGGKGVKRIDCPDDLLEAAFSDADAFYLTAFHDYCSPDDHFRKYRVIFVDRQPYPYHLAISKDWLVHYFSADMLAAPWKRDEERRFLEDPKTVLGAKAWAAIEEIAKCLDLDFAGIDFTLLPNGRVLFFEANATMLVHLQDSKEDFPYKHAVVSNILSAFEVMLHRHECGL